MLGGVALGLGLALNTPSPAATTGGGGASTAGEAGVIIKLIFTKSS